MNVLQAVERGRSRQSTTCHVALLALGLLAAPAPAGRAQIPSPRPATDPALEAKVRDIASMLRCPVCLNLSVQDSPSELAGEMRDLVRDRLLRGETEKQVLRYFVQRYGEWILMEPPKRGMSLLVWLLPAIAVLGGGSLVVLAMQRWIKNSTRAATPSEPVEDEYVSRVREELARRSLD